VILVQRHGRTLKGYALRILRNPQSAEEVTVESFERLASLAGKKSTRSNVRGLVFTIAHNLCMDRKRKNQRTYVNHEQWRTREQARRLEPSPEARVLLGELARNLEDALQTLPDEHRQVVILRLVQGHSSKETALILGIDERQVSSRLAYGRFLLKQRLDNYTPAEERAVGGIRA